MVVIPFMPKLALRQLRGIIERTRVQLRGWDFPHLSSRDTSGTAVRTGSHPGPRSAGTAIIGGVPKWAVPSSSRIRETVEVAWGRQLREIASTFSLNEGRVEDFFDFINFLYSMKVFEPAANLCQAEVYRRGRCRLS